MELDRKLPHLLITAGPTVEDLDPVRFISNRASGRLGFELARAASQHGCRVWLIHGPVAEPILKIAEKCTQLERIPVRSCDQMHQAVFDVLHAQQIDAAIMNAAVADFTPAKVAKAKLKKADLSKGGKIAIYLKPTKDICAEIGKRKKKQLKQLFLIGFALETGQGRSERERRDSRHAEAWRKLKDKNCDAIVLDTPGEIGALQGHFELLAPEQEPLAIAGTKRQFACKMIDWLLPRLKSKRAVGH